MIYKVAVASSDGKFINQHFGRSKQFLIFEIHQNHYNFLTLRENQPPCSGKEHSESAMERSLELISDCRVVLVSQIGPGAWEKLKEKGIRPLVRPNFIAEALRELIEIY